MHFNENSLEIGEDDVYEQELVHTFSDLIHTLPLSPEMVSILGPEPTLAWLIDYFQKFADRIEQESQLIHSLISKEFTVLKEKVWLPYDQWWVYTKNSVGSRFWNPVREREVTDTLVWITDFEWKIMWELSVMSDAVKNINWLFSAFESTRPLSTANRNAFGTLLTEISTSYTKITLALEAIKAHYYELDSRETSWAESVIVTSKEAKRFEDLKWEMSKNIKTSLTHTMRAILWDPTFSIDDEL